MGKKSHQATDAVRVGGFRASGDQSNGNGSNGHVVPFPSLPPLPEPPADVTTNVVPPEEHYTDLGNAVRLVVLFGQNMRHCAARRVWYVWDGKRWAPDANGAVMRMAKATVRAMYRDAEQALRKAALLADEDKRKLAAALAKALLSYAIQSEARSKLEAMVRLAESERPVPVTLDQLDANPWLLNTQNGTLDLRTGQLREHRREDLITSITPTDYNPDARDDRFTEFLEQVLPESDVSCYVQKALGYSIGGTGDEGGLFLPFGPTHTGKTTILEAAKAALGDYAVSMDVETLTGSGRNRDGSRAKPDIVRLFGARLVVSTEVPAGVKLDEALVKKLTGGDTLWARTGYEFQGTESVGTFVIWLGSNFRPAVRDDDDAVWERVRQIPFTTQHIGPKKKKDLRPYLQREHKAQAAVLAWLVEGFKLWQAGGLEPPDAVKSLTENYRLEMNPLTTWANESCVMEKGAKSTYSELRLSYEDFTRRGDRPIGTRRFQMALKMLPGVEYDRDNGRVYRGIKVAYHEE